MSRWSRFQVQVTGRTPAPPAESRSQWHPTSRDAGDWPPLHVTVTVGLTRTGRGAGGSPGLQRTHWQAEFHLSSNKFRIGVTGAAAAAREFDSESDRDRCIRVGAATP
jgi:hypothetical protein